MKLIFASDSFKGSLSSRRTAELLTRAAREVFGACECIGVPIADGGEGTVDAVIDALKGERVVTTVHDPLMDRIQASYGIAGDRAIIEMAAASGLTLVPDHLRDPLNTTTYGTGELILDALDRDCRKLYIAIGGSATNDGGMGCLRALGARFLDKDGNELSGCGKDLAEVSTIDLAHLDSRLSDASVTVLCDVKNPLCGENGATYTFAKQKGANPEALELLEYGMQNYRDVIRGQFGIDCDMIEGAGAAGGLGAALNVFLHAIMQSGIETVLDLIGFDDLLDGADLVVTGEGRADAQSVCGKVMQGVALCAKARGIPVYGLCGSLGDGAELLYDCGVTSLYSLVDENMSVEEAMANAEDVYYHAAVRMFSKIKREKR
jgi:glycerate kinase